MSNQVPAPSELHGVIASQFEHISRMHQQFMAQQQQMHQRFLETRQVMAQTLISRSGQAPSAPAPAPTAVATIEPAEDDDGGNNGLIIDIIIVVVLIGGGIAFFAIRSRRRI